MHGPAAAAFVALGLFLAGCAAQGPATIAPETTPPSSDGTTDAPERPPRAEDSLALRQGTTDDGDSWYSLEGRMTEQGIWLDWTLDALGDSWGASHNLLVSCGKVLFLPPAVVEFDEGDRHFAFEPDIRLRFEGSTGGAMGAGTSADDFVGGVSALVAEGTACISYNVTIPADVGPGRLEATRFNASWSMHGPYAPHQGSFTVPVSSAGWTHAHRVAACDTQAEDLAPSHLVSAALEFPNGVRLRAGPYMNGLFPGPTVDDATYFGVWQDVAGDLAVQIAAPTPECLLVLSTDFLPKWSSEGSGYVDRWWRQEPVLGASG